MDIAGIAALAPVIPVLTIERVVDAVPLAQALLRGGLRVLEITLRTPAALEALAAIADQVPEATAGVGTVLAARQFEQARRAGARFAVSPGYTPSLAAAARSTGLPYLPGVQTVSEAMALADQGFKLLKLFPADTAGGITWLRAVAGASAGAALLADRRGHGRYRTRLPGTRQCCMRGRFVGRSEGRRGQPRLGHGGTSCRDGCRVETSLAFCPERCFKAGWALGVFPDEQVCGFGGDSGFGRKCRRSCRGHRRSQF
jgi:2-dehydro-3-deoxyphosphogluconate aldolase / (4S)-4-hydroxy-2-oxoglutarate aldolase